MKLAVTTLFTISLALFATGCAKEEGPMEKMGKDLDKAVENAQETAEDVADDMKEAVEK